MARPTMANIISTVRAMIYDIATPQKFTDDQIQTFLDLNRVRLDGRRLYSDSQALEYYTGFQNIETNLVLSDQSGQLAITSGTINYDAGTVSFSTVPGIWPYAFGYAYDIHAASAELWLVKAGTETSRNPEYLALCMDMHELHLEHSWPKQAEVTRSDTSANANARIYF